MFWTWDKLSDNEQYISWGQPRSLKSEQYDNCAPNYEVKVYRGERVRPGERAIFMMSGDATLGFGDSIWLINYLRDFLKIKGRLRCHLDIATSPDVAKFYSHFFPKNVNFIDEYITKKEFDKYDHKLPAMYYWKENEADKSWADNQSILQRLYNCAGIEYFGLSDWRDFTPDDLMFPDDDYYKRLGIEKDDKYIFFQWHSSGEPKNIHPRENIKLIKHLIDKYKFKCYIIGRLKSLDKLEKIPGVVNLAGKTTAEDLVRLAVNSELIVGPDSAGMHLGEAYKIPSVCIMSVLPPVYVASKYKIPAFMYGSGKCPNKICGVVSSLPILDKCPKGTENYCAVMQDIDLNLFDKCVIQTVRNVNKYRNNIEPVDFYESNLLPISLN